MIKRGSYIFGFFFVVHGLLVLRAVRQSWAIQMWISKCDRTKQTRPKKKLGTHKRRHGGWCDSGGEHAIVIPERRQRIQDSPKMSIGHVYDCDGVCVCVWRLDRCFTHTKKASRACKCRSWAFCGWCGGVCDGCHYSIIRHMSPPSNALVNGRHTILKRIP